MQTVQRVLSFCLRQTMMLLALSVVLLATLVSLLRFGLPYAEGYKTDIEHWIAERYAAKVQIGQLSAGWQQGGPALLLQQVQVRDVEQQPVLAIAETSIRLDFWGSLRTLSLKAEHFELSGVKFTLDSHKLLQVEATPKARDNSALLEAVEQLLFRQLKNFTLVDSEVTIQSQYSPNIVIAIQQLSWRNQGARHQASGDIAIAGVTRNTSQFILDLHGDTLASSQGQLYLASQDLDVLPWFRQVLPSTKKLSRADINFQAWGDIQAGKLTRFLVLPADNRLVWQQDGQTEQLQLGHGQVIWQPTERGWQLATTAFRLQTQTQSWHDLQWQIQSEGGELRGAIQQLPIAAFKPLAQLLVNDIPALAPILDYQLSGRFTQLSWQVQPTDWFVSGDFLDLSSMPAADVPGVSELSGHFSASKQYIRLNIQGRDGQLRWADAFVRDTPYQQLQAQVELIADSNWRIVIPELTLRHPELALDAEMVLQLGEQPALSLLAELRGVAVEDAHFYFPTRHMPASVINYLTPALLGGQIPQARVLWHGAFREFPFRQGTGKFQALAQIDDAEFSFDVHWPRLTGLDVALLFDNAQMQITSQTGDLFGVPVGSGVEVSIADLFQADDLWVKINTQARAEQVKALMLASPLSESVGKTLDYLGIGGLVGAQVQLQIGLKQAGVTATGDVDFYSTELAIQQPAVQVEQLQGRLSFHNDKIHAERLWLQSQGVWLQTTLQGQQQDDAYQLTLLSKGEHEFQHLLGSINQDWAALGQGRSEFDWQLSVQLPSQGFRYQSNLLIDLTAATLALPSPYSKTAADAATLVFDLTGDEFGADIQIKYGEQLRLLARFDQARAQVTQALLSLGLPTAQLSDGFHIEVDLPRAEVSPWLQLIQQQLEAEDASGWWPSLNSVRGKIAQVRLFDDVFLHQTRFDLQPMSAGWQLTVTADETKGTLRFGQPLANEGIQADIERLNLVFADQAAKELAAAELQAQLLLSPDTVEKPDYAAQEASAFAALPPMPWLADLPPLRVNCQQCSIGTIALGTVQLKSYSDGQSWFLTDFTAQRQGHRWQITGQYQRNDLLGSSQFSGTLQSPALGQLLQDYDVSSSLVGSPAEIEFVDLSWQGAPFQFNRHTLAGQVQWEFGAGSLSDVSDGGARIFSLLSLDSLVRKLRLDFRDVFAKGFFFSKMSGSMQLQDGVSHTADTAVIGTAGDIRIQGYADLKARQLDYQMSFAPKVTSSIPVILAWMVNPVSGVAAFALDEVFQSAEVISNINFTVTGDFANPLVTEVKRDSKTVPLPAELRRATPVPPPTQNLTPPFQLTPERKMPEATLELEQTEPTPAPTGGGQS